MAEDNPFTADPKVVAHGTHRKVGSSNLASMLEHGDDTLRMQIDLAKGAQRGMFPMEGTFLTEEQGRVMASAMEPKQDPTLQMKPRNDGATVASQVKRGTLLRIKASGKQVTVMNPDAGLSNGGNKIYEVIASNGAELRINAARLEPIR